MNKEHPMEKQHMVFIDKFKPVNKGHLMEKQHMVFIDPNVKTAHGIYRQDYICSLNL